MKTINEQIGHQEWKTLTCRGCGYKAGVRCRKHNYSDVSLRDDDACPDYISREIRIECVNFKSCCGYIEVNYDALFSALNAAGWKLTSNPQVVGNYPVCTDCVDGR